MITLIPVPGNVAKVLQSTERELMKKVCSSITIHEYLPDDTLQTDARIQTITESTCSRGIASFRFGSAHKAVCRSIEYSAYDQALWMGVKD